MATIQQRRDAGMATIDGTLKKAYILNRQAEAVETEISALMLQRNDLAGRLDSIDPSAALGGMRMQADELRTGLAHADAAIKERETRRTEIDKELGAVMQQQGLAASSLELVQSDIQAGASPEDVVVD